MARVPSNAVVSAWLRRHYALLDEAEQKEEEEEGDEAGVTVTPLSGGVTSNVNCRVSFPAPSTMKKEKSKEKSEEEDVSARGGTEAGGGRSVLLKICAEKQGDALRSWVRDERG